MIYAFFFLALAAFLFWMNLKAATTPTRATTFILGWLSIVAAILLAAAAILTGGVAAS